MRYILYYRYKYYVIYFNIRLMLRKINIIDLNNKLLLKFKKLK